jgi:hypothetical protein
VIQSRGEQPGAEVVVVAARPAPWCANNALAVRSSPGLLFYQMFL